MLIVVFINPDTKIKYYMTIPVPSFNYRLLYDQITKRVYLDSKFHIVTQFQFRFNGIFCSSQDQDIDRSTTITEEEAISFIKKNKITFLYLFEQSHFQNEDYDYE